MKIAFLVLVFDEVGIPDYLGWVIDGIKRQTIDADIDVLFVDNLSSDSFRDEIKKECDANNWECISIPQPRYPIQVCKNIGWKWFTRNGAKYDYYAYCCDDIVMDSSDTLQTIITSFTPAHGIVTPYVAMDAAPVRQWKHAAEVHHSTKTDIDELSHAIYAYAHFMVFSNEFFEQFNYREMDIFWNYGFESLWVYFCKSVGMKWKWCCQTILSNCRKGSTKHIRRADRCMNTGVARSHHVSPYQELNTAYVYFDNKAPHFDLSPEVLARGGSCAAHFDAIFAEGTKIGLGWHRVEDGSHPVQYVPDMSNYDSNGEHKDKKKLHEYMMKHLFLSNEALNYKELLNSACFVRVKE